MKFWASVEVHKPAYGSIVRVEQLVTSHLNLAFGTPSLTKTNFKLRYIPIVMPKDMHHRYPERSKARIGQRIYDCSPYLDYEVFVHGTLEQQLEEYMRGIALSVPYLHKFGFSPEQVEEFRAILDDAVGRILLERRGRARC